MGNNKFDEIQEITLPAIEQSLNRFFDRMTQQGVSWNSKMSSYHFSTGGKRLRAVIPSVLYAMHNHDPADAIPLGCAIELIHNATLVHDDLQDQDTVRRGKPTVWKKYSDVQAINCGDALYQFAFEMLLDLDISPERLKKVIRKLVRGTLEVIEGQAQEFLMKDEEFPSLDRYLGVIRGKTAALFSASILSTLEALGSSSGQHLSIEKAAMQSGVLFQIQDDLLDIYGDKQRDRKATDIAEGKISALIACLNDRANLEERKKAAAILKMPREQTGDAEIHEVIHLFEKYEIKEAVLELVRKIQVSIETDQNLQQQPQIHQFLVEMNQRFLKPIEHLL